MATNKAFDINSNIVEDWLGGYKLELDLAPKSNADNWTLDFELPYKISAAYGVDLVNNGNGSYTISGQNDWANLNQGQSIKPIFIIEDNGQQALNPEFKATPAEVAVIPDVSLNSGSIDNVDSTSNTSFESTDTNKAFNINSNVVEDWLGGYKLELDLTSESNADNWTLDFELPYKISAAYGVDLVNNGNGSYTISGQNNQANLNQGQSIKPIFIIEDNGQQALTPEFKATPAEISSPSNDVPINSGSIDNVDSTSNNSPNNDIVTEPKSGEKIISVDNDFGGNLASAIASANNGDIVQLGSKTYYTSGITIDKDITIDGQKGSVVNGGGTLESIFTVAQGATGATIQDIEITNGNNGISGNGARNLLLQNLNVNNIGINNPIREGQNNTGISLGHADGLQILNIDVSNIGRKGVSVGDTNGAIISGISVQGVNLAAQHAQSHDAAGIKFFNTNQVTIKDSYFADINAMNIWNDTTNGTVIDNNVIKNVGEDFIAPGFNNNVDIHGIYNEKSSNSIVKNNSATAVGSFAAFNATEFTTETMTLENNNNFSSSEIGTQDYWVNEEAEKLIALTENPDEANFDLFADEYYAQANI